MPGNKVVLAILKAMQPILLLSFLASALSAPPNQVVIQLPMNDCLLYVDIQELFV